MPWSLAFVKPASLICCLEERNRVRRIRRQGLVDIPMLHNTAPVHAEQIHQRQQRAAVNLEVHHPDVVLERLVQDRPVQARDQERQEGDGGGAALRCVGRVVDVVGRHVGQVGVCGVLLDVELVDEVEEDGVLLAGVDISGGAEGGGGDVAAVVAVGSNRVGTGSGSGEEGGEKARKGSEEGETHGGKVWKRWWKDGRVDG